MRRKLEMSRRKQLQNFEILREFKIEKTKLKKCNLFLRMISKSIKGKYQILLCTFKSLPKNRKTKSTCFRIQQERERERGVIGDKQE